MKKNLNEQELIIAAKKFNKANKGGKLTPKITHAIVPFDYEKALKAFPPAQCLFLISYKKYLK